MLKLHSKSNDETKEIAAAIAELVQPGDLILASGDLGAGKTTFTQGFGAALGITETITSPTFVLMCNYQGRLPLHHVDVYRLDQLQEVIELGLIELLDEGGVAVVEWGEGAAPALPNEYLALKLLHGESDDSREIEIDVVGNSWGSREELLSKAVEPWTVA